MCTISNPFHIPFWWHQQNDQRSNLNIEIDIKLCRAAVLQLAFVRLHRAQCDSFETLKITSIDFYYDFVNLISILVINNTFYQGGQSNTSAERWQWRQPQTILRYIANQMCNASIDAIVWFIWFFILWFLLLYWNWLRASLCFSLCSMPTIGQLFTGTSIGMTAAISRLPWMSTAKTICCCVRNRYIVYIEWHRRCIALPSKLIKITHMWKGLPKQYAKCGHFARPQ